MKKRFGNFVLLVLALSFLLSVSALAADTRASAQISDYYMDAYAYGGGQIAIEFSVACNGRMSRLGALEIAIYEKSGTSWLPKHTYTEYSAGMAISNSAEYSNTIYYDGTVGRTYKVEVTVFARNSEGEDMRFREFTSIVVR